MSHPFTWVPAANERHASKDPVSQGRIQYAEGQSVTTLCGQMVEACDNELAWLWWTCPTCDDETRAIVGVPLRTETSELS
ncbi:hypothetical protein CDG81_18045 [Actinopolyspora erythraea]|uniref:Zinc-finger domain-containing protein n=1 Tax=Actinopolyspora erythraea TaxID=414996 RepID=A0A099D0T0_9ACTN|nr:zinc finger protein [Actinopolyspora erythraea]ASU79847.1 hypothetical protein CDG81_18045 [Actinopolyspora erythraea]KGI79634.1 hypothetical protein IL38_22015 [Actinopolyspora erythraea]